MKQHEIMKLTNDKLIKAFENILKSEPTEQQKKEKALEFAEELKNEGYTAHAIETPIQDCVKWYR